jgi:hypothetical protein
MSALLWRSFSRKVCTGCLWLSLIIPFAGIGQIIDPIIGPPIRIISPPNHFFYLAPANVSILAYVSDRLVTNVEFYANTNIDLGPGMNLGSTNKLPYGPLPQIVSPGRPITSLGSVYALVWSNVPPGVYALTAVEKHFGAYGDTLGTISYTSAPVSITVLPRVTVTNGPSVVSITACDPVAVVGTNSWIWPGATAVSPVWTGWPPRVPVTFTNWGPKGGLFTARRLGGETNPIAVTYNIGGTASNGVDYVKIPGTISFGASQAFAFIPIIPIDTNPPPPFTPFTVASVTAASYIPKTVVLTLNADTNAPPEYLVGLPKKATVVIERGWLRLPPLRLPDGSFHLNADAPDGAWFAVQSTADFVHWTNVCTNQVVQGSIDFVDADAPDGTALFYQAVPQSSGPTQ